MKKSRFELSFDFFELKQLFIWLFEKLKMKADDQSSVIPYPSLHIWNYTTEFQILWMLRIFDIIIEAIV